MSPSMLGCFSFSAKTRLDPPVVLEIPPDEVALLPSVPVPPVPLEVPVRVAKLMCVSSTLERVRRESC